MGSPDTALKVSPFTPSHPLKDRLFSFTDFILSNIEEWSDPHPPWPVPPPPLSFSGTDRVIRGRLPHRTIAISASLSSLFSDSPPLVDACEHGDGPGPMQFDSVPNIVDVAHNDNDVTPFARSHCTDVSSTLARTQSGTSELSNLVRLQVDGSAQDSCPNDRLDRPRNDMVNASTVVHSLVDHGKRTELKDADSLQIPPHGILNGSSEIMLVADGHSVVVPGVLAVNTQPNALDHRCFAMEVTDKGLQDVSKEAPAHPPLAEQVDDLEDGELSERFLDDGQLNSMEEGNGEGESYFEKGASRLEADVQRSCPSDASIPEKRVLDSETDEEMNEPISAFVSRCRMQSFPKPANQKVSSQNTNSESVIRRDLKLKKAGKEHHVLEKALSKTLDSTGEPEQLRVLQEGLGRVAIMTDVSDGKRLLGLQDGSIQVSAQGILDTTYDGRMDGAMGTPSKRSVQQAYTGVGQPEAGKVCKDVEIAKSLFFLVSLHLMALSDFSLISSLPESTLFDVGVTYTVGCHLRLQKLW